MGTPLEDKPQSILYKLNLLFSMGIFPEITFDKIKWEQDVTIKDEFDKQMAFFQKVSQKANTELETIIRPYLESVSKNNRIIRKHNGLTATAIWKME